MTSAWRVISFFFVIFVLPTILISVPLYARYKLYSAKTLYFTNGDMHSLHKDVSRFWCQKQLKVTEYEIKPNLTYIVVDNVYFVETTKVVSWLVDRIPKYHPKGQRIISNGTFEAFLTPQPQRLSLKRHKRRLKLSSELLFMEDDVEQWGFYLIKGSRFSFSSCARWPGGTLLVVKGEENLRRCFYKEERFEQLLKDGNPKEAVSDKIEEPPRWKFEPKKAGDDVSDEEDGGGEVHTSEDKNDDILDTETIKDLYASQKDTLGDKKIIRKKRFKKIQPMLSKENSRNVMEETDVNNTKLNDSVRGSSNQTTESTLKTKPRSREAPELKNMINLAVNKGSFFYNEEDAFDVTSGNSSYSSSEEFLSHCRDTLVSIDLTPYIDCQAKLKERTKENKWHFAVNESDFYYFIFFSDNSIEANVISFRLKMNRALYDVSEKAYDIKCSNSSECTFPLPFTKSTGVIVDYGSDETPVSKLNDLQTYELISICQPRSIVYTVFILLVPFIIFLFAFR